MRFLILLFTFYLFACTDKVQKIDCPKVINIDTVSIRLKTYKQLERFRHTIVSPEYLKKHIDSLAKTQIVPVALSEFSEIEFISSPNDEYFYNMLVYGDLVLPFLIDRLDDTTTTKAYLAIDEHKKALNIGQICLVLVSNILRGDCYMLPITNPFWNLHWADFEKSGLVNDKHGICRDYHRIFGESENLQKQQKKIKKLYQLWYKNATLVVSPYQAGINERVKEFKRNYARDSAIVLWQQPNYMLVEEIPPNKYFPTRESVIKWWKNN